MIAKIPTQFDGLYILESAMFKDNRGSFKKIYNAEDFKLLELNIDFKESYYSINKKDVIRGMHFQTPPYDHSKIVYCISGSITDICLDIRKKSPTYGKWFSIELTGTDSKYIYIPKGFAHGFSSHEDNTIVHYFQTSCYAKDYDCGIRFDSFGLEWNIQNPIVSGRDLSHPKLVDYSTPFSY
jgi:dTDP-4-dehydrorhamnose 3,5-epimerase/CDP-3, 6-dideoxy-D-glycero-D-glycero-4-hexulose-5-epimerase